MRKDHRRRLLLASGAFLAAPLASFAQSPQKVRRIGCLSSALSGGELSTRTRQQFAEFLQGAGFEDGKNLKIEWRYAEGHIERLAGLAEELVRLNVELIVAFLNDAIAAAKRATQTVPIVMANSGYPVEYGFVESLARPGGNITGTAWEDGSGEMWEKLYQLLIEALPRAKRVAELWNPAAIATPIWNEDRRRSHYGRLATIGISAISIEMSRPEELTAALDRIAGSRADALLVSGNPVVVSQFKEIANFARQQKLVSISPHPGYVSLSVGGLLNYGPDYAALIDRAASYIVRILRGAKPRDLPVELPTKYALVLNAKTARAIGFKPPESFMLRVDRQIE